MSTFGSLRGTLAERKAQFVVYKWTLLMSLALFVSLSARAQVREAKTVLFVEDQISAPAVETVARELETNLTSRSLDPLEFYRESLDTMLIPEENYQSEVRDWYERKYSKRKLDLVVAIGPAAHDFVRTEHDRVFHGVPAVFCLDIKPDGERATPEPNSTGVWMEFDPVSTVNAARQLLPGTKHVAVVAGTGLFDQMLTNSVKTKLKGYQGVDFTYLSDLDISSLLRTVHSLSKDTVILYLSFTKDRYERHMFSKYALPLVSNAASVPVFGLIDLGVTLGLGMVGGRVTMFTGEAPVAAEIALRVLNGKKPEEIPAVSLANEYSFDGKQLQRWGLDASRLPFGSSVLNRGPNIWQRYRGLIFTVFALLLLQGTLLVYLLIERRKRRRAQQALEHDIAERKKAEAALIDLSRCLINAREEEQSRVARELHDDFNQRLAVLAIELKRTSRLVDKDPGKASQRLDELCVQTGDIAGDLHKLSHNLHSSVLYSLGLVDGVHSLCAEFTEQQGVQVVFTSHGIPRNIPAETSLCLFRIAQEALRNVKKHSGANKAFVELNADGKGVALSIIDTGVGFDDREPAFKAGLGLRSMRERLRTVGGTIEIYSRRGGGTRVSVRAPLIAPLITTLVAEKGAYA